MGGPLLQMPMLGGSVPMYTFAAALHMPIVGVPLANADNNQHGANENLRLQNLWDGIEIYAGLLTDVSW
jgi:acetylornithine deacetylase/succinyl-diaminopimelate desuccinylase-like protein